MNILLVSLNPCGYTFHLGVAALQAVLDQDGHRVETLFLSHCDHHAIDHAVAAAAAAVIGISVSTDAFPLARAVINYVHHRHALPVILGGIHPTTAPDECLALTGVVAICRGEGELPARAYFSALAAGRNPSGVAGLWIKAPSGRIIRNPVPPPPTDLDSLPFPDYSAFSPDRFSGEQILPVMLARGCPFSCPYCCNHALRRLYGAEGNVVRRYSPARGMALIEHLLARFPATRQIEFFDDVFTLDRTWLDDFLTRYARIGLPFVCNSRFDVLDEPLVAALTHAGCRRINVAVECGSESLRRTLLLREISDAQILDAARIIHRHGIELFTHNMLGLPGETKADILQTIELNRHLQTDRVQVSIFTPYPATDLNDLCQHRGWLDKTLQPESFQDFTVLRLPTLSRHAINYFFLAFRTLLYESGWRRRLKQLVYWLVAFNNNRLYRRWGRWQFDQRLDRFLDRLFPRR